MCLSGFQWDPSNGLLATVTAGLPALTADSILSLNTNTFSGRNGISISLREIIDRFANKPDIMDLLLKAKIEEDKRLTEQYRCRVEVAREEMRQRELELLDQHNDPLELNIDHCLQKHQTTKPNTLKACHQPLTTPDALADKLLSQLEFDIDPLQLTEANIVNDTHTNPLKRKVTDDLPVEHGTLSNPKQASFQTPSANVTMEAVQRKKRIQQADKKERPQQKFMQMMKLVRHP